MLKVVCPVCGAYTTYSDSITSPYSGGFFTIRATCDECAKKKDERPVSLGEVKASLADDFATWRPPAKRK